MKEALQRMENKKELQTEETEQVPQKEEPALSLMELEQGPQMDKGVIQLTEEAEQGLQKEEVTLHEMEENQGLQMKAEKGLQEVALHPIEEEQGLQMEDTLPGLMEAEQGLQIQEALAGHLMEAEQGLQMEETLIIQLMEAELAEMRSQTSSMREKRVEAEVEAEAAVEAKRNELELRKINRDQHLNQLLLLEVAEQVFLNILFPPQN